MPITLHTVAEDAIPEQTDEVLGRFRDDFQQQIDKDVETLKTATAKAKWPAHNPRTLHQRYFVGKDDVSEMKRIIRRACNLFRVEPAFYKDATTEAGHVVIKFHVDRKTDKDGKFVKDDTLNDDGTPKAPPAPKPTPPR